jgi:hypothetical protein
VFIVVRLKIRYSSQDQNLIETGQDHHKGPGMGKKYNSLGQVVPLSRGRVYSQSTKNTNNRDTYSHYQYSRPSHI